MLSFYFPAFIAILLTIGMIFYPKEAFEASLNGLAIWWNIVFPALLPFFIFSQLLIGLGVVHFLGVLLEPIMRPVFNVPGVGSFVMAMGLASGFPIGAVLTTKLREDNLCNKVEAERLMSFTNTADPLFMFGAVAVGMLHAPSTGMIIALAHYLSSISVGLIMRFYRAGEKSRLKEKTRQNRKSGIVRRALKALVEARQKDNRPFGKMLGETVAESVKTLLLIGGFIMLFSVVLTMLDLSGIISVIAPLVSKGLTLIKIDPDLSSAFIRGLFELDLGCQTAGSLQSVTLDEKIIAVGVIIAWSGLSVHAQVASITSSTDISIIPYLFARVVHAILAGIYTALLLGPLKMHLATDVLFQQVFLQTVPQGDIPYWYSRTIFMGARFILILSILVGLSLLIYYAGSLKTKKNKVLRFNRF